MNDQIFVLIIVCIVVVFVAGAILRNYWQEQLAEAQRAYEDALLNLKQHPNNPDFREMTLRLGRIYSSLANRSIFDEMALMNDINAACARATVGENTVANVKVMNPSAMGGKTIAEEIEQLGKLFLAGVITAEEFERGKALFLGAPPDKAATAIELLKNLDMLKKNGVISESEFNVKKWEILSERLIPGKIQAAKL